MIREKFLMSNAEKVRLLQSDRITTICLHEAGHTLMLEKHHIEWRIELPLVTNSTGIQKIIGDAKTVITSTIQDKNAAIDVCFGGFCAELAFLDEAFVRDKNNSFETNAPNARNDILRLLELTDIKVLPAELKALRSSPYAGGLVVTTCFLRHGQSTFTKMIAFRAEMVDVAQRFYDKWRHNGFKVTGIRRTDLAS